MDETAVVAQEEPLSLVAVTPSDIAPAQAKLKAWCDRKIQELRVERSDLLDNAKIAKDHGWSHENLLAMANKVEQRIGYYLKLKEAVSAGYVIVPNFDLDVIAVRVNNRKPRHASDDWNASSLHEVAPQLLPSGEGRYVSGKALVTSHKYKTANAKNEIVEKTNYQRVGYIEDIEFPVAAVKPIVMEATARAMSLRLFDRIGIVKNRKADPIIVGQLVDPRGSNTRFAHGPDRVLSFFVAWWIDVDTL